MAKTDLGRQFTRGEWTEFCALLKLLGDGKLHSADKFFQRKPNGDYAVGRIVRGTRERGPVEYLVDVSRANIVIAEVEGDVLTIVPMREFSEHANTLLQALREQHGRFSVPASVWAFMGRIFAETPKSPAIRGANRRFQGRSDLLVQGRDGLEGTPPLMGFSVKASVGRGMFYEGNSFSQLLFRLKGCNDELMKAYNRLFDGEGKRDFEKRKQFLREHRFGMRAACALDPMFDRNLSMVHGAAVAMLAWCVRDILLVSDESRGVMETVKRMTSVNPLGMPDPITYERVMKDVLMAFFFGLRPCRIWKKEKESGGYLFVTDDDVVGFHTEDEKELRDFLYAHTMFDFVSLEKGDWGNIFKNGDEFFLELNASLRFEQNLR